MLNEDMLKRFYELKQTKKEIEDELNKIRRQILTYFDETQGKNINSEKLVGNFLVQRKIRIQEKYHNELMVKRLKELGLEECVKVIEEPDVDKVESALSLKFIKREDLVDCIKYKYTPYIMVEKYT